MTTKTNNKRRSYEEIMADTLQSFVTSDAFQNSVRTIVRDEISKVGATKPTTSSKKKPTATKVKEAPKTWTEKKAEYASKFTEEERKAYGEQKKLERANQKEAYAKTNEFFKDKGYVGKATWRKKYNEILASLVEE